jgi:hypothetical protein
MLTYFRAENFKCLERVEIPLTPIHVLIGQNDSGKTSVLEAMRTYMQSIGSDRPVHETLPQPWKGRELVFHGAAHDAHILLTAKDDESRAAHTKETPPYYILGYGFQFTFQRENSCLVTSQWLERKSVKPVDNQFREDTSPFALAHPEYTAPSLYKGQQKNAEEALFLPRGFLGQASLYRFDPKTLALPAGPSLDRKFRMDVDGFGLATLLDDIIGFDPHLFLHIRESFCEFFPQFKSVHIESADAYGRMYDQEGNGILSGRPLGKEVFFTTQWGGSVRARQASEGMLLFLAFLALSHLPPAHRPKLILVEDVERGVYPKKLRELVTALKKWVSEKADDDAPQIVLSTHSPYVLSFFEPKEVTFMTRVEGGGVRARPLRDAPNIEERLSGGFYLGELWFNVSEEDLLGDTPR